MSDFIAVTLEGDKELAAKFRRLAPLVQDEGTDEADRYIVRVMKEYSPYRYVTRASAYGTTWFSEKQRRYVMARISDGTITPGAPHRTQALSHGWKIIGSGVGSIVANEVAHAALVQGNRAQQSRHAKAEGWKGIDVMMKDRSGQIARMFAVGTKRAIKILGLS